MADDVTDDDATKNEQLTATIVAAALDALRKQNFLGVLLALLGLDEQTLEKKYGISREDIEEELGPEDGRASRDYSDIDLTGIDGPLGTGRALAAPDRVSQLDLASIEKLSAGLTQRDAGSRTAELARRFVGQHEVGDNGGALVRLANGYEGDAWCGGFTHYITSQTMPGVYNQAEFRSARSYMDVGKKYGAFHERGSDYAPKAGDVLVFSRGGDPSKGHVGIITSYDAATGHVTYVSGNDGNAVREREFDLKNPPRRLLGFTDSVAVAQAKSIHLEQPQQAPVVQHAEAPKPHAEAVKVAAQLKASGTTHSKADAHASTAHFSLAALSQHAFDFVKKSATQLLTA